MNRRNSLAMVSSGVAASSAGLHNVVLEPAESCDVANLHPEIVAGLLNNLEALIPMFPPQVVEAYATLKANNGSIMTSSGASPRSLKKMSRPGRGSQPAVEVRNDQ
jgi:arylsulfatase